MNCPLILITDAQLGLSFLKTISILSLPQQPYLASIRAISNKSMANFISLGKKKGNSHLSSSKVRLCCLRNPIAAESPFIPIFLDYSQPPLIY